MANPMLRERTFLGSAQAVDEGRAMTVQGTVNRAVLLLGMVLFSAAWIWKQYFLMGGKEAVLPWMIGGMDGGLITGFVTIFRRHWAAVTAPIYALFEGLILGGVSAILEAEFPGIVMQAVGLTFTVLFSLLAVYTSGLIRVTQGFKLGVAAATGGVFLIYLASFVLGLFGIPVPYIHENGWTGLLVSLAIVVIAALNLVLDFDLIEHGAKTGQPAYMEWYAAFALLVTLIWLYLEILRLLAKLRSRD